VVAQKSRSGSVADWGWFRGGFTVGGVLAVRRGGGGERLKEARSEIIPIMYIEHILYRLRYIAVRTLGVNEG
jgi:hypothetical protein